MNPLSKNYLKNFSFNHKQGLKDENTTIRRRDNQKHYIIQTNQNQIYKKEQPYRKIIASFDNQKKNIKAFFQYTHEGYLFAYNKNDHIISGRSFVIFPDGIIANCNVLNQQLSGWNILCKKNVFYNISKFQKGHFQGSQYTYDIGLGLTVQSVYKSGKISSVKHGIANDNLSFERYIKNKELIKLLHDTLNHQYFKNKYPFIQSSLGNFYGEIHNSIPRGVGVLLTQNQYFYGQFSNGLLNGVGTMLFQNGDHYIGQFEQGIIKRYGIQTTKGLSIVKYDNQSLRKINQVQYRQICSFQETQLYMIFHPIVRFYLKLKEIYAKKIISSSQKGEISFVEVNLQNIDQENQQKEGLQQSYSEKSQLNKSIQIDKQPTPFKSKPFELSNFLQPPPISIDTSKQPLPQKKDVRHRKKSVNIKKQGQKRHLQGQNSGIIKNDMEWNEVIEQLQQKQSINRQNGFLYPKNQNILKNQNKQSSYLKKGNLNNHLNLHPIKIQEYKIQEKQISQNKIMKKLLKNK